MTNAQIAACIFMPALVLLWFICVFRLDRRLRDYHPEKYEQMGMAKLMPRKLSDWNIRVGFSGITAGFNNTLPVLRMARFLWSGEDQPLNDAQLSSLSKFMRWLFIIFMASFALLFFSIFFADSPKRQLSSVTVKQAEPDIDHRRSKAFRLHKEKNLGEAIVIYDELLKDSTSDAELLYWRGTALVQMGKPDLALLDFRNVIRLEPDNFDAHVRADRILSRQGLWDEVLEMWDRYIARNSSDAEALFERGGTHFHRKDLTSALADAESACALGKAEACQQAKRLSSSM